MDKDERSRSAWATLWREGLTAVTLGWELAIPIFGGVLLGYALDRWLGTGHTFTLGLMVLGVVAGFYNLWRFNQRLQAAERRLEAEEREGEELP